MECVLGTEDTAYGVGCWGRSWVYWAVKFRNNNIPQSMYNDDYDGQVYFATIRNATRLSQQRGKLCLWLLVS